MKGCKGCAKRNASPLPPSPMHATGKENLYAEVASNPCYFRRDNWQKNIYYFNDFASEILLLQKRLKFKKSDAYTSQVYIYQSFPLLIV